MTGSATIGCGRHRCTLPPMSSHHLNICVVALGKIGLPLAVQYARQGHSVIGADVEPSVVEHVNAGPRPLPWRGAPRRSPA